MHDRGSQWLIPALLAAASAAALWLYWQQVRAPNTTPPAVTDKPAALEPEPIRVGPRYPIPQSTSGQVDRARLIAFPALDQSDEYFKLEMAILFGIGVTELLVDTAIIEKLVAMVDNLPRQHLAERIRPLTGVVGPYLADGQDDSGEYPINTANYQRYDFYVNLLANADLDALAEVYRRFYPLFQEAYAGLGYPQAYFNDRVIEVIDHLLETPEVPGPVALVRPHVLYEYADPELEALSSGQKLLLRIGNDHSVRVKQFLEELRVHIAESAARQDESATTQ